jgi:hypothetical protein
MKKRWKNIAGSFCESLTNQIVNISAYQKKKKSK